MNDMIPMIPPLFLSVCSPIRGRGIRSKCISHVDVMDYRIRNPGYFFGNKNLKNLNLP